MGIVSDTQMLSRRLALFENCLNCLALFENNRRYTKDTLRRSVKALTLVFLQFIQQLKYQAYNDIYLCTAFSFREANRLGPRKKTTKL
jgi:hypothetical protein